MSEHRITLHWSRTSEDFQYKTYNRAHRVTFKNDQTLPMSAAPAYRGDATMVDPEEAFVASLSSCHMLTFLAIAARDGFVVDSYTDAAVGFLEKNDAGRLAVTRVELHPEIAFAAGANPDAERLRQMHHQSHEQCFIANSVNTVVTIAAASSG